MEEQKYFIPEIGDIYSGYQYEKEKMSVGKKLMNF